MKPSVSARAIAAAFVLAIALPVLAQPVWRYNARGDGGDFYFGDFGASGNGFAGGASFSKTGPRPEAFVCYYLFRLTNWNAEMIENGCGQVPDTDVTGSARGILAITTDTSGPDFNRFLGNGGFLDIRLRKRDPVPGFELSSWRTGLFLQDYGSMVIRSNGSESTSPATATGTFLTVDLPESSSGHLYGSRQMVIEIQSKTP